MNINTLERGIKDVVLQNDISFRQRKILEDSFLKLNKK